MPKVKVRLADREALLSYFKNHPSKMLFASLAGTVRIAELVQDGFDCSFCASSGLTGPIEGVFRIPSYLAQIIN